MRVRTENDWDRKTYDLLFLGFNTGVALYNLKDMRASTLYNSYLSPGKVKNLMEKYQYSSTLAEQVNIDSCYIRCILHITYYRMALFINELRSICYISNLTTHQPSL